MLGERCDIEALGVLDRAIVFHDADDLEAFRAHDLGGHSADFTEPWMTTQQVSRFPSRAGERVSGQRETAVVGAADAAGTEWKCAVYRKVQEGMKADRGLRIGRMVELGGL